MGNECLDFLKETAVYDEYVRWCERGVFLPCSINLQLYEFDVSIICISVYDLLERAS